MWRVRMGGVCGVWCVQFVHCGVVCCGVLCPAVLYCAVLCCAVQRCACVAVLGCPCISLDFPDLALRPCKTGTPRGRGTRPLCMASSVLGTACAGDDMACGPWATPE